MIEECCTLDVFFVRGDAFSVLFVEHAALEKGNMIIRVLIGVFVLVDVVDGCFCVVGIVVCVLFLTSVIVCYVAVSMCMLDFYVEVVDIVINYIVFDTGHVVYYLNLEIFVVGGDFCVRIVVFNLESNAGVFVLTVRLKYLSEMAAMSPYRLGCFFYLHCRTPRHCLSLWSFGCF